MRAGYLTLLFLTISLSGCAGERPRCELDAPSAALTFHHDGTRADVLDALRDEGWTLAPGDNPRVFRGTHDATGHELHGTTDADAPAGTVHLLILAPEASKDAHRRLAPVVEPLATRFDAAPEYRGGAACA